MDPQDAVDLVHEALMLALTVSAPVLAVGMIVGLAVSLLQALTQVQEQTIAFVPKLLAMLIVLCLTLPWLLGQIVDYTRQVFENIPGSL
jgi:flagellar biosynthesis protein FliQ